MKKILISAFTIFATVAAVAGATAAVFSDTKTIPNNTLGAADVEISLIESAGTLFKPVVAGNLVPGQWSDWYHIDVFNAGTVESDVYMYGGSFTGTGGICANTNLLVQANSGSGWYEKYNGPLLDLDVNNRAQLKDAPLAIGDTLLVKQRVQLDEDAPNSAQGETCTWDEVFTAENVVPTP